MEESDNTDISGISDTTSGQIEEEGEDGVTSVTKSKKAQSEEQPDEQIFNAELPEPETDPNAAVTDENAVSINFVGKDLGAPEGEDGVDAESIAYIGPVKGYDNGSTTSGNIVFKAKAKPGWTTLGGSSVEVTYPQEGTEVLGTITPSHASGEYTIATNKGNGFTADLTVTIQANRVKNALTKDAGTSESMYLVGTIGEGDDQKVNPEITTGGVPNLPFETFFSSESDAIRIAVRKDDAGTNKRLSVALGGQTKTFEREGSENIQLNGEGEARECVIFAFKPADIDDASFQTQYEGSVNAPATYTVAMENAQGTAALKVDASPADGKYAISKITADDIEESSDYKFIEMGNFDTSVANAVTGLTRDIYRMDGEKKKVVVFNVTAVSGKKLTKVYAEFVKTGAESVVLETIPAKDLIYTDTGDENKKKPCYGIVLSDLTDSLFDKDGMTLKLKADVEYISEDDKEAFANHKIEFTGDLDTVVIRDKTVTNQADFAPADKALKNPYETEAGNFNFAIQLKPGYTFSKGTYYNGDKENYTKPVVTVSYDKVYSFNVNKNGQTTTYYVRDSKRYEDELEVSHVKIAGDASHEPIYELGSDSLTTDFDIKRAVNETIDDVDVDANPLKDLALSQNKTLVASDLASVDADNVSYKNIKIDIKTELTKEKTGKVQVVLNGEHTNDMSYDITGTDITRENDDSNFWNIGWDAELLTLNITSEVKPDVTYEPSHTDGDDTWTPASADVTGSAGAWTAKIPVSLLEAGDGVDGEIAAMIFISRGSKTITVYKDETGTNAFEGDIQVKGPENTVTHYKDKKPYNSANPEFVKDGNEVAVTLYAKPGNLFDKAYYVLEGDKEETKHDLDVNAEKTEASFTIKMTNNVKVYTTAKPTFHYVVKYTDNGPQTAEDEGEGIYPIPAGVTSVEIAAYSGAGTSTIQNIYSVKAYDGGALADCIPSITGNVVNLTLSDKDGELLRLEIKGKKDSGAIIDMPSISIRQDKLADEVVIKNSDGEPVESVTVLPDDVEQTFTVEVVSGSLTDYFLNGNIALEIARDASRAGQKASSTVEADKITVEYDGINAVYNTKEKTLKIKGLAGKKGNENPVFLRFYDVKRRNNAVNKNEEDKLCVLKGSELSVKLDSPAVALVTPGVTANNTVHNLQLNLSAPEFKQTKATWYRVKIAERVYLTGIEDDDDILDNAQKLTTTYTAGIGIYKTSDGREIWIPKYNNEDSQEILIPVYYEKGKDQKLLEKSNKYNLTVDLVQSITDSATPWNDSETTLATSAQTKLATETAEAVYPTDLTLDKSTATIYTGQKAQKVATASFGNVKGVRQLQTGFVNAKTGAPIINWIDYNVKYSLTSYADLDGNIYVDASNMIADKTLPKNLGLKVSTFAKDANEISKIITLKFVNGVDNGGIGFENGRNKVLYKQEGKKATLKIKAVINEASGVKAKNQKLITYTLGDAAGKESYENGYQLSKNLQSNVTVNPKNGTVTVSKDYVYENNKKDTDNKFSVIAKVAGTDNKNYAVITIIQEAQTMGSLVIVDGNGNVIARDGGTISAETFASKDLYVRALKSGVAQTNNRYNGASDYNKTYAEGVSFTSGNKKALTISKTSGKLTMVGAANNKAVKITAVNTDGSKKVKSTISVTLTGPKNLGLRIDDANNSTVKDAGTGTTYTYSGALKEKFVIYPYVKGTSGSWGRVDKDYYKNLKITVKGAKKTEKKNAYGTRWFEIVKSAPVTTITISDKTDKTVAPVVYTIEQSPATPVKGKALKIKTVTKLTETMLNGARTAAKADDGKVKITFRITGKDASAYAGMYVMLTPDYSKKKLVNKIEGTEEYVRADNYFLEGKGEKLAEIGADGTFTLDLVMYRKALQERIPGTYKLVAAVGNYGAGGQFHFVDGVKSTTVSVKIPGKAPKKLGIEAKSDYTLSAGGGKVLLETGISSAYNWGVYNNYATDGNLAKNAVGADGTINHFRDYFEVTRTWDENGKAIYWLGMKEGINQAALKALLKDTEGKDRKGFVTVTSAHNGKAIETKDVMINVNLVDTGVLTAKAKDTYRGAKASVRICSAEGGDALALFNAALDKAETQSNVKVLGLKKDVNDAEGDKSVIEVEISEKAGDSVSFNLRVLTKYSAFAKVTSPTASTTTAYVQENGDIVPVTINLADPSTATDTVKVLTKDEDLVFKAIVDKNGYKADRLLAADDSNKQNYNSYFETGSIKKYGLRVDVESTIEGAEVSSAQLDKTTADKTVQSIVSAARGDNNNEILITLDHKKFLQECAKEGSTIAKGGTIEIPVTVKFTLSKLKEQTIKLNVTLPSPKTYEEAKAAMQAAQADIESLQPDEYLKGEKMTTVDTKVNLQAKINNALRTAVPLDAEAILDPATINLNEITPVDGKYKKTVLVKEKSTKQDKDYSHEFVWSVPGNTKWTADGFMAEVEALLGPNSTTGADKGVWLETQINALDGNKSAGKIVDNSYTGDDFLKDLTAMLKKQNIEAGKNIVVNVDYKVTKRATTAGNGYATITISAKDAEDKNDSFDNHKFETVVRISQITTLVQEGAAVKEALTDAKFNYKQAIYDALGEVRDIDGLEDALARKIEAAAKDALTNKNITVAFKPLDTESDENNSDSVKNNVNVRFKLPNSGAGAGAGYVKYHLLLKLDGAKDYEIVCTADGSDFDLAVANTVKNGKTFQTIDGLGGDSGAFSSQKDESEANADKILKNWTEAEGANPDKAVFKDKIDLKDVVDKKGEVQKKVKTLTEKVVNGMYLSVSVTPGDIAANAEKVTGKVKVTDDKKRKKNGANYYYEFDFEMDIVDAGTDAESSLGAPRKMTPTEYAALGDNGLGKNKPAYDRIGGDLTIGAAEKIGDHEYRIPVTGTLKYVENWTGFSATETKQKGYYAMLRIPIPKELKALAAVAGNASKNFVQVGHDETKLLSGAQLKDDDYLDLTSMIVPDVVDSKKVKVGEKSKVRGFKVAVDWNTLGDSLAAGDDMATTNVAFGDGTGDTVNVGAKEYQLVTYTIDMSGVTLDNSSEAIIEVLSQDDARLTTAITEDTAWGVKKAAFNVSGDNKFGKSNVVSVTGTLNKQHLPGFSTVTANQDGYYMYISLKAPSYVATGVAAVNTATAAKLQCYNPTTQVANGNTDDPDGFTKLLTWESDKTVASKFAEKVILVRVNDADRTKGKNVIKLRVDWDASGPAWGETEYTLDLSNVNYAGALPTP